MGKILPELRAGVSNLATPREGWGIFYPSVVDTAAELKNRSRALIPRDTA